MTVAICHRTNDQLLPCSCVLYSLQQCEVDSCNEKSKATKSGMCSLNIKMKAAGNFMKQIKGYTAWYYCWFGEALAAGLVYMVDGQAVNHLGQMVISLHPHYSKPKLMDIPGLLPEIFIGNYYFQNQSVKNMRNFSKTTNCT